LFLLGIGAALFAPVANAQQSFIKCPVETLDTQVVSKLPSEWWTTPQRGSLLGTEVRSMGGRPILVCNYSGFDASIPVLREQPAEFMSCAALGAGFVCSTTEDLTTVPPDRSLMPVGEPPRAEREAGRVSVPAPVREPAKAGESKDSPKK
jgi:hypothetical protein